jgi:hypothetical protein
MSELPSYDPVGAVFTGTKMPTAPNTQPKTLRSRSSSSSAANSASSKADGKVADTREVYVGENSAVPANARRPGSGNSVTRARPGSGNRGQTNAFSKPPRDGPSDDLSVGGVGIADNSIPAPPVPAPERIAYYVNDEARTEMLSSEAENRVRDILQSKYGVQLGKLNLNFDNVANSSTSSTAAGVPGGAGVRQLSANSLQFIYDDNDDAQEVLTDRTARDKIAGGANADEAAVIINSTKRSPSKSIKDGSGGDDKVIMFTKPRYTPPKQGAAGTAYRRDKNAGVLPTKVKI